MNRRPWLQGRLVNQLVFSFIGIFVAVFLVSTIYAYFGVYNLLKNRWHDDNLAQMGQYAYNLNTFHNEIDYISRQLIVPRQLTAYINLQKMIHFNNMPELERTLMVQQLFYTISEKLVDYPYIDSIMFFNDEGLVIAGSADQHHMSIDKTSEVFQNYTTLIKPGSVNKLRRLAWIGGLSSENFHSIDSSKKQGRQNYISAARSIMSGNEVGTLVINIKLEYFTSIYNHANLEKFHDIYLTDKEGWIISHNDEANIGLKNEEITQLSDDEQYMSLEYEGKQVIIHNVLPMNWRIVSEVPLKMFGKDAATLRTVVFTMFIIGFVLSSLLSLYWIYRVTRPLVQLTSAIRKVEYGELGYTLENNANNELGVLIKQFNKMSINLLDANVQKERMAEERRELEIQALQSQINPHFLYNTLNTIKWMAMMIKADNIVNSITSLSNLLHPVFNKPTSRCTLEEEFEYTQKYIDIMNYRYSGSFEANFTLPESLKSMETLRFILQPIVENAIYHGLHDQNIRKVNISARRKGQEVVLTVTDDGRGMSADRLAEIKRNLEQVVSMKDEKEQGIGLSNVQRRIELHYGKRYGVQVHSKTGAGTVVELWLPYQ